MANAGQSVSDDEPVCYRWLIGGRVQAVGFRPFIYRLAVGHGLHGYVQNSDGHVVVVARGRADDVAAFEQAMFRHAPPLARPYLLERQDEISPPSGNFTIMGSVQSTPQAPRHHHVAPDYYLCADCRRDMLDPLNRRYRYPFTNCTQCAPRYSLIAHLPYDRCNTAMAAFDLCADCRAEYTDPFDRRYHAQPLACPACGPTLCWQSFQQSAVTGNDESLLACVTALRRGDIVAVKGVGGYHLLCDAMNPAAIATLRRRKQRPHKALAVMVPSSVDRQSLNRLVELDEQDWCELQAAERPIVLLRRQRDCDLPLIIAPGLNEIGLMLPYSPLHHLLLDEFAAPVVCTSANLSGEPVMTDNIDVERRLQHIADGFLHHDRPILHAVDDSVIKRIDGRGRRLRIGRGFAPLELTLPFQIETPLLAVGGHMKSTVTLAWERRAVVSSHLGDLTRPRSQEIFNQTIKELQELYQVKAKYIVCDAHNGYSSHRWARHSPLPSMTTWHHHAHASALAGEVDPGASWLMFTWDGAGAGEDGTVWGGEALLGKPGQWQRVASFRPFRLPGADLATWQPWRSALALCWQAGLDWADAGHYLAPREQALLHAAWQQQQHCHTTTAVGRLFDAAAALTGLLGQASYDGHAPMCLEAIADETVMTAQVAALPTVRQHGLWRSDWAPLLQMLMSTRIPVSQRAGLFQATLAETLLAQACALREQHGRFVVGLTGGVFQNRLLVEQACRRLRAMGFTVFVNSAVPCNDAGLSFGQIIEAAMIMAGRERLRQPQPVAELLE